MKTVELLFPLIMICGNVFSNIVNPMVYISEIYIESSSIWSVELGFYDDPAEITFDSIVIETKTGSSRIADYTLIDVSSSESNFSYLAVITDSNLVKTLEIDKDNDFVKIYSYFYGSSGDDYVAFGNYPGSCFLLFKEGYSIVCRAPREFSLDKTPSLGETNTEEGMLGTVEGYLLDRNQVRQANSYIVAYRLYGQIFTDENGYYSEAILSRTYFIDDTIIDPNQTYIFVADTFNVMPDSISYEDIVILSCLNHSGIIYNAPQNGPNEYFTNYPNPFRDITTFYFVMPQIKQFKTVTLEIFNNTGQSVISVRLPEDESVVAIPSSAIGNLTAGTYHYTLFFDGEPSGHLNTLVKLP